MSYTVILGLGLFVVVLVLIQLYNETGAQIQQVRKIFDHVVIRVFSPEKYMEELPIPIEQSQLITTCPVLSTSITCGRKADNPRYQVDLPIETSDKTLKETAAEFFVEPEGDCLRLYVRPLDQMVLFFGNPETSGDVFCVAHPSMDPKKLKTPALFAGRNVRYRRATARLPYLKVGDVVMVGETRMEIAYYGGEKIE